MCLLDAKKVKYKIKEKCITKRQTIIFGFIKVGNGTKNQRSKERLKKSIFKNEKKRKEDKMQQMLTFQADHLFCIILLPIYSEVKKAVHSVYIPLKNEGVGKLNKNCTEKRRLRGKGL